MRLYQKIRRFVFDELPCSIDLRTRVRMASEFASKEDATFHLNGRLAQFYMRTPEHIKAMQSKHEALRRIARSCYKFLSALDESDDFHLNP